MQTKKGQTEIFTIFALLIFFSILQSSLNDISCKDEKASIQSLNSQLSVCQESISIEKAKYQDMMNGLGNCQDDLSLCKKEIANLSDEYYNLKLLFDNKEQPVIEYYFIKIFSDKILIFNSIVIYNIYLFLLFVSFGISFTVKLFQIDIHVLNKKNQKILVKGIREDIQEYLANDPYMPIILIIIIILISNLFIHFV